MNALPTIAGFPSKSYEADDFRCSVRCHKQKEGEETVKEQVLDWSFVTKHTVAEMEHVYFKDAVMVEVSPGQDSLPGIEKPEKPEAQPIKSVTLNYERSDYKVLVSEETLSGDDIVFDCPHGLVLKTCEVENDPADGLQFICHWTAKGCCYEGSYGYLVTDPHLIEFVKKDAKQVDAETAKKAASKAHPGQQTIDTAAPAPRLTFADVAPAHLDDIPHDVIICSDFKSYLRKNGPKDGQRWNEQGTQNYRSAEELIDEHGAEVLRVFASETQLGALPEWAFSCLDKQIAAEAVGIDLDNPDDDLDEDAEDIADDDEEQEPGKVCSHCASDIPAGTALSTPDGDFCDADCESAFLEDEDDEEQGESEGEEDE